MTAITSKVWLRDRETFHFIFGGYALVDENMEVHLIIEREQLAQVKDLIHDAERRILEDTPTKED